MHLVGAGAIGLLHSYYLKTAGIPVTLILRASSRPLNQLKKSIRFIDIKGAIHQTVFDIDSGIDPINTLIVCTKAYDGLDAIKSLVPRLSKTSNIVLLSNGCLKLHDEIKGLFPSSGPTIYCGMTSHGVVRNDHDSTIIHTGFGETRIGCLGVDTKDQPYFSLDLARAWSAPLGFISQRDGNIYSKLLIKLAVNCCLNPLSVLMNCKNGTLLSPLVLDMMRVVCDEVACAFPLSGLDSKTLMVSVKKVLEDTFENQNSVTDKTKTR